jgi:hypothetical protein
MHATKAAVEEGVVAGDGALLYAVKALGALAPENNDQKVGVEIVRKALQSPEREQSRGSFSFAAGSPVSSMRRSFRAHPHP